MATQLETCAELSLGGDSGHVLGNLFSNKQFLYSTCKRQVNLPQRQLMNILSPRGWLDGLEACWSYVYTDIYQLPQSNLAMANLPFVEEDVPIKSDPKMEKNRGISSHSQQSHRIRRCISCSKAPPATSAHTENFRVVWQVPFPEKDPSHQC